MIHIIILSLFVCILNTSAASADSANVDTGSGWLTSEVAQRNYSTVQSSLAPYGVEVANSILLYLCYVFSKSDFFQSEEHWLKMDICIILHTLRKESETNAAALAQTFRQEDNFVMNSPTKQKVFQAFSRCVPAIHSEDREEFLNCLTTVNNRYEIISNIRNHYQRAVLDERFSRLLEYTLWQYVQYVMSPESACQDSQPYKDPEDPVWLTSEAAQRHYGTLESNLAEYVAVDKSVILQVCCALLESDYESCENIWVKTEIETILYLLCQASAHNAEQLAHTFDEDDQKLLAGEMMICHALGRCVPEVQPNDINDIGQMLSCVLNVRQHPEIVHNIMFRYQQKGAERFSIALKHILSRYAVFQEKSAHQDLQSDRGAVSSESCEDKPLFAERRYPFLEHVPIGEGRVSHPEIFMDSQMHCAFVQPCPPFMQSVVMVPGCYPMPQPLQHPMTDTPYGFPPMQNAMYPFVSQCPQPEYQSQTEALNPRFQHLLAYVYRGVYPNPDSNEPDYMSYAFAEEKLDIMKELPNILDRLGCMVKENPSYVHAASMHNVHLRLREIKKHLPKMTQHQKALLFAWAFVMERQSHKLFYDIGFLRDEHKNIHYLWISCRSQIPHYLYALTECTDIQDYLKRMRSHQTYHEHQLARETLSPIVPSEKRQRAGFSLRERLDLKNDEEGSMKFLFSSIFPDGDAPSARALI